MKVRTAFEIITEIVYICMQICMLGPCAVVGLFAHPWIVWRGSVCVI